MKSTLLLLVWILMLAGCRGDPQPTSQSIDFDAIPAEHSLDAFDGTLVGHDRGEWGGRLAFREGDGNMSVVFHENVQALLPRGDHVVVFTGLAHLGTNRGAIYLLSPDTAQGFKVHGLYVLEGRPERISVEPESAAIRFRVFTGSMDSRGQQGEWLYLCRSLGADNQLSTLPDCG